MKKIILNVIGLVLIIASFAACKSTKKGCGLTSDAQKIEQSTAVQQRILAEV